MEPEHVKWPKIGHYSTVVETVEHPETPWTNEPRLYLGKIKLHGCNVAVGRTTDGDLYAQSRNRIITPGDDQYAFAAFVRDNEPFFTLEPGEMVYGEWCGRGINQGAAICNIDRRVFVAFAGRGTDGNLYCAEEDLLACVDPTHHTMVLPYMYAVKVDYGERSAAEISRAVDEVEQCDPWVKSTFGISGVGEGLVFYPTNHPDDAIPWTTFEHTAFKAKGQKHAVVTKKAPATKDPARAADAEAFARMVLPEARLEQGMAEVGGTRDIRQTGAFLKWVLADVQEECQAELTASNLTWDDVKGPLVDIARAWWFR